MMTDDAGGCQRLPRIWTPRTGLFAIVAGIAFLSGACSSGSSTPQVASLGTSGNGNPASNDSGTSAAPVSTGNATRLVDEWVACMRSHGDTAPSGGVRPSAVPSGGVHVASSGSGANG
jgi:hypothetical protein